MSIKIKHQLKELRTIVPDAAFKERERGILLAQIKNTVSREKTEKSFIFGKTLAAAGSIFIPFNSIMKFARPVMASFLIVVFALGGGIATVGAAMNSLPGDPLYGVKRATEKVRLTLTSTEIEKAKLQLKFADARMDEVTKISKKVNSPEKPVRLKAAVENFKEEMNTVKTNVGNIIKTMNEQNVSEEDSQEFMETAIKIGNKKEEFENALNNTKENLIGAPEGEYGEAIRAGDEEWAAAASVDTALETVNAAAFDALKIIVFGERLEKVKVSDKEIAERLDGEFLKLKANYDEVYILLKNKGGQENLEKIDYALFSPELRTLKDELDNTLNALETIEYEIGNNEPKAAYDNIKYHKDALSGLKEKINAIKLPKAEPDEEDVKNDTPEEANEDGENAVVSVNGNISENGEEVAVLDAEAENGEEIQ